MVIKLKRCIQGNPGKNSGTGSATSLSVGRTSSHYADDSEWSFSMRPNAVSDHGKGKLLNNLPHHRFTSGPLDCKKGSSHSRNSSVSNQKSLLGDLLDRACSHTNLSKDNHTAHLLDRVPSQHSLPRRGSLTGSVPLADQRSCHTRRSSMSQGMSSHHSQGAIPRRLSMPSGGTISTHIGDEDDDDDNLSIGSHVSILSFHHECTIGTENTDVDANAKDNDGEHNFSFDSACIMRVIKYWENVIKTTVPNYKEVVGEQIILHMMELDASTRQKLQILSLRSSDRFGYVAHKLVDILNEIIGMLGPHLDEFEEDAVFLSTDLQKLGVDQQLLPAWGRAVGLAVQTVSKLHADKEGVPMSKRTQEAWATVFDYVESIL